MPPETNLRVLSSPLRPPAREESKPCHLMWHEREVLALAPDRFRVRVPMLGGPAPTGLAASLDLWLAERWVGRSRSGGPRITSVITAAQRWNGCTHLTLVISTDGAPSARRIDGTAMASDLRLALRQIADDRGLPAESPSAD